MTTKRKAPIYTELVLRLVTKYEIDLKAKEVKKLLSPKCFEFLKHRYLKKGGIYDTYKSIGQAMGGICIESVRRYDASLFRRLERHFGELESDA